MNKLNKIIEQVLEVKVNKPFNPKQIIEWFKEDPDYFYEVQGYDNFDDMKEEYGFDEDNDLKLLKEKYETLKSLYDKKNIECDYGYDGFDVSEFKKIYTEGGGDGDLYILLTKF